MKDTPSEDHQLPSAVSISKLLEISTLTLLSIYLFVTGYINSLGIPEKPSLIEAILFYLQASVVPFFAFIWKVKYFFLLLVFAYWTIPDNLVFKCYFYIKRKLRKISSLKIHQGFLFTLTTSLLLLLILEISDKKFFAILLLINIAFPSVTFFEMNNKKFTYIRSTAHIKIIIATLYSCIISYAIGFNYSGNILEFGEVRPGNDLKRRYLWKSSEILYVAKCPEVGEWQVRGYNGKEVVFTYPLNRNQHKSVCLNE